MIDTVVLRALGALLIVNSHSEPYYPLRQLAFGGLVGDSLFFFLSGFGLALGQAKSRRGFLAWYGRRAARILPSVLLVVLIFNVLWTIPGEANSWDAILANLVGWGPANRFVGQILTMYVPIFLVLKMKPRGLTILLMTLCVPYAAIPFIGRSDEVFHAFHWLYYFHQMVFGVWIARREKSVGPADARIFGGFIVMAAVLVTTRAALASGRFPNWFFVPHLMAFPLIYLLLRCARARVVASLFEGSPRIGWAIATLGGATLETYLIHTQLIPRLAIESLGFPLGITTFLVLSVVLGCLLAALTAGVRGFLFRSPAKSPASIQGNHGSAQVPSFSGSR